MVAHVSFCWKYLIWIGLENNTRNINLWYFKSLIKFLEITHIDIFEITYGGVIKYIVVQNVSNLFYIGIKKFEVYAAVVVQTFQPCFNLIYSVIWVWTLLIHYLSDVENMKQ